MFKLFISVINNVSTYMIESNYMLWHARLGHLNFASLKYMSNDCYIAHKLKNVDKCEIYIYIYMQAKMTKKPFPRVERI